MEKSSFGCPCKCIGCAILLEKAPRKENIEFDKCYLKLTNNFNWINFQHFIEKDIMNRKSVEVS